MKNDLPRARIYRLKLIITCLVLAIFGLLAAVGADWLERHGAAHIFVALTQAMSDLFLFTGVIAIAIDIATGRDKEAANTQAVIRAFAFNKEDLRHVASPELLDTLATNALSLRLGDDQFAEEIYKDILDQAIHTQERWTDVAINVRLSSIDESSTRGAALETVQGSPAPTTPLFDVLIEWEFTTTPRHARRKFACVSDHDEYRDLANDVPATSAWFMSKRPGMDASARESFELLYFSVDGEKQDIDRKQQRDGQTYTVRLDEGVVRDRQPVRIRHIYRTRTTQAGHFLFVAVPQPARGLHVTVDYVDTDITELRVTDMLTSARGTTIVRKPMITGEKSVSVDHPGWVRPRAGVAVAWTLASEDGSKSVERVGSHA